MDQHGSKWINMNKIGSKLIDMENIWIKIDQNGSKWIIMDQHRLIWIKISLSWIPVMIIFVISLQIRGWFIPSGFPRPGGKWHQRGGIQGGSLRGSPRLSSSNTPIVDRFWLGITISSWEAQFFLGLKKRIQNE